MLQLINQEGEFVTGEDGFVVYWPDRRVRGGAYNSWLLRTIADYLDEQNRDWFNQLEEALSVPDTDGEPLGL